MPDADPKRIEPAQPEAAASIGESLDTLARRLRAHADAASLSFIAIKSGGVGLHGATSAALESSLANIRDLVDRCLADLRLRTGVRSQPGAIALDAFIEEVRVAAHIDAWTHQCELVVGALPPGLVVSGDRPMLNAAVSILLQNAFRYTRPGSSVWLDVRQSGDRILIEVADECGGFPVAACADSSGTDHGLSVVRRAIEANGGTLALRNSPGSGCTMSIELPALKVASPASE